MFDCPGQIELYSHLSVFKTFVEYLKSDGWSVCVVYCLDCHFMTGALHRELVLAACARVLACARAVNTCCCVYFSCDMRHLRWLG